jgi:hypothetical protein
MSMEGMPLSDMDKFRIRECIDGRKDFACMVKELVDIMSIPD